MDHNYNDEELPKEAIEISDVEEYDVNLANLNSNIFSNENVKISNEEEFKKRNYVEMLEKKIREQAQRLIELQTYKTLCENKIKQAFPDQPFPLNENHIRKPSYEVIKTDSNSDTLKNQIKELKAIILSKDEEINKLTKNHNGFLIQTKQFSGENSKFINLNNNNKETLSKNTNDFPRAEKIPNDNLRDNYNKLWNQFKELGKEKDQLMDSLKKETIRNEEQRNYIDILRQTIDSSLNKLGLNQLINNQKNNFPKHLQNTDIIVECTRYKSESEINKKENIILNIKINELKQEIEYLTTANQEMQIKKEKIRETLETGIKELEVAKERVKKLEQDKEYLIEDFENVKTEYEKAINDYNSLLTEYEKIKSENTELLEKKEEFDKALITQTTLENKLIEHKTNFEKLNEDYKTILKERNNFEMENTLNQEEIQSKNNKISELKEKIEKQEDLFKIEKDKLNDEMKSYHKQLNLLEKQNSDNLALISSKENIIKKLEDKVLYLENNSNTYKQLFEDVTNEFTQFKEKSEEESETLKNFHKEIKELKEYSDNLKEENTKLKEATENLEKENNKKKENLEEHNDKIKGLNESCENFIKNKSELEKQNLELKEFSDKVTGELDNLKKNYTEEINLKESEIEQIYSELAKFKSERDLYKSKLNEYTNDLEFLKNENINLEKESQYKVKLLQEENDRKDKNLRKSYEDCFSELDYYKKITLEMKDEIDKLQQTLFNSEETIDSYKIQLDNMHAELEETYCRYEKVGKELQETLEINQELESKYNGFRKKYEEVIQRLDLLELENVRIEKNRRKLFEENEYLKKNDKISPKTEIKNNFKDIKSAIHSCLNVAKNFINKIVSNKEYNDFSKIFTDKLPQYYHFSSIPSNENNAIDSLKSLEDWIRIVCNELENCFINIQELSFNRNSTSKLFIQSHNSEEIDSRKIQVEIGKVQEENKALLNENELLRNRINYLSTDINLNRENKKQDQRPLEDYENLKKEIYLLRENNQRLLFENNLVKKRENSNEMNSNILENVMFQLAKSFPNSEMMKFTQDIVLLTNHISQIEKEKAALEKKLSELEFDSQSKEKYKESLKENNELETENLGAIYFEIENIRKILDDYDKILMEKKNLIRKIESEIRNIGMNSKYNMENYYEIENKNKQLQKEIEEVREEFKKSKNSGSSNVFKSNYIEKPQEKKHNYDYNKNIDKFERPRRDLINSNSLSVKSIEHKEYNPKEKYSELQSNDLSFSRNKNLRDLNLRDKQSSNKGSRMISTKDVY